MNLVEMLYLHKLARLSILMILLPFAAQADTHGSATGNTSIDCNSPAAAISVASGDCPGTTPPGSCTIRAAPTSATILPLAIGEPATSSNSVTISVTSNVAGLGTWAGGGQYGNLVGTTVTAIAGAGEGTDTFTYSFIGDQGETCSGTTLVTVSANGCTGATTIDLTAILPAGIDLADTHEFILGGGENGVVQVDATLSGNCHEGTDISGLTTTERSQSHDYDTETPGTQSYTFSFLPVAGGTAITSTQAIDVITVGQVLRTGPLVSGFGQANDISFTATANITTGSGFAIAPDKNVVWLVSHNDGAFEIPSETDLLTYGAANQNATFTLKQYAPSGTYLFKAWFYEDLNSSSTASTVLANANGVAASAAITISDIERIELVGAGTIGPDNEENTYYVAANTDLDLQAILAGGHSFPSGYPYWFKLLDGVYTKLSETGSTITIEAGDLDDSISSLTIVASLLDLSTHADAENASQVQVVLIPLTVEIEDSSGQITPESTVVLFEDGNDTTLTAKFYDYSNTEIAISSSASLDWSDDGGFTNSVTGPDCVYTASNLGKNTVSFYVDGFTQDMDVYALGISTLEVQPAWDTTTAFSSSTKIAAGTFSTDAYKANVKVIIGFGDDTLSNYTGTFSFSVTLSIDSLQNPNGDPAELTEDGVSVTLDSDENITYTVDQTLPSDGEEHNYLLKSHNTCMDFEFRHDDPGADPSSDLVATVSFAWDDAATGTYDFKVDEYVVPGIQTEISYYPTLDTTGGTGAIDGEHEFHCDFSRIAVVYYQYDYTTGDLVEYESEWDGADWLETPPAVSDFGFEFSPHTFALLTSSGRGSQAPAVSGEWIAQLDVMRLVEITDDVLCVGETKEIEFHFAPVDVYSASVVTP